MRTKGDIPLSEMIVQTITGAVFGVLKYFSEAVGTDDLLKGYDNSDN